MNPEHHIWERIRNTGLFIEWRCTKCGSQTIRDSKITTPLDPDPDMLIGIIGYSCMEIITNKIHES